MDRCPSIYNQPLKTPARYAGTVAGPGRGGPPIEHLRGIYNIYILSVARNENKFNSLNLSRFVHTLVFKIPFTLKEAIHHGYTISA